MLCCAANMLIVYYTSVLYIGIFWYDIEFLVYLVVYLLPARPCDKQTELCRHLRLLSWGIHKYLVPGYAYGNFLHGCLPWGRCTTSPKSSSVSLLRQAVCRVALMVLVIVVRRFCTMPSRGNRVISNYTFFISYCGYEQQHGIQTVQRSAILLHPNFYVLLPS